MKKDKANVFRCIPSTPEQVSNLIGENREVIGRMVKLFLKKQKTNPQDLEDLISLCWVAAYKKIPGWYDPSKKIQLQTVVYKSVKRTLNTYLKRSRDKRQKIRDAEIEYHKNAVVTRQKSDPVLNLRYKTFEEKLLENCVPNGSPIQQILYYRYVENKDWREVEAVTGINYQTAINTAQKWYDKFIHEN